MPLNFQCDGTKPRCSPCELRDISCLWGSRRKPFRLTIPPYDSNRNREKLYIKHLEDQVSQLSALLAESRENSTLRTPRLLTESNPELREEGIAKTCRLTQPCCPSPTRSTSAVQEFAPLDWNNLGGSGHEKILFSGPGNFSIPGPALGRFKSPSNSKELSASKVNSLIGEFSRQEELKNHLKEFFLKPSTEPLQLLYSVIFAVSAHCLHVTKDLESALLAYAEKLDLSCSRSDTCLPVIKALSILAWLKHTLFQRSEGFAYQYLASGLSMRLKLDEVSSPFSSTANEPSLDYIDSVRTFWSLFLVERTSTPSLGVPLAIPWDIIQPPVTVGVLPGSNDSIVSFEHHCSLLQLNHIYVEAVYTSAFKLLSATGQEAHLQKAANALAVFRQRLNTCIVIGTDSLSTDNAVVWISYHAAVLNLHRPFLHISHEYKASDPSTSMNAVTTAAEAISELLNRLETRNVTGTLPPLVIYHIFRAALVHGLNMTSSDVELESRARKNWQSCLRALCEMRKMWGASVDAYVNFLHFVARDWGVTGIN
ncbi:hypothetical protein CEP54_001535 [Fusarium duplospermum]|uniref:Transcription factor domain-containing protein n=1 Tax=Fusarium duplospermum TaxID=1325734 RepID=A0A428R023_9HYPO|nr:hypothetical protein CEP54_001535 [Fusarium duplospermum]